MNSHSITWVKIGRSDDVPSRGARRVSGAQYDIAVFRTTDNKYFAVEDRCPHSAGPLSAGIVHDNCVTCPLHNWVISLETGEAQGADEGSVRTCAVKVENGDLMIDAEALR